MQKLFEMKNKIILLITSITILVLTTDLNAQCEMCKAVEKTNLETGDTKGMGLNSGILYLMAFPYIAASIFAIVLFVLSLCCTLFSFL